VVEAHRVLADLQDHRGVDALGAFDDRFGVLQRDDVEGTDGEVVRGGAVDQLTGGDQGHGDRPSAGLTASQRNATVPINTQANNP
jgi:hypothetical protein